MKQVSLFLLILLIILPGVHANSSAPVDITNNLYLDGNKLEDFQLMWLMCKVYNQNDKYITVVYTDENCTWFHYNAPEYICTKTPCEFEFRELSREDKYELDIGGKRITLHPIVENKTSYGVKVYDVYAYSNGTVQLAYIKDAPVRVSSYARVFIIFILLILGIANAGIEILVGMIYFKIKNITLKGLWWMLLINMITYPLMHFIGVFYPSMQYFIMAEIAVIILEGTFYAWIMKKIMTLKDAFTLSIITNVVSIILGLILSRVTGISFGIL